MMMVMMMMMRTSRGSEASESFAGVNRRGRVDLKTGLNSNDSLDISFLRNILVHSVPLEGEEIQSESSSQR